MKTITLKFTDEQASNIGYFLRKKYKADKRTGLPKLCKIAIFREIREQANIDSLKPERITVTRNTRSG